MAKTNDEIAKEIQDERARIEMQAKKYKDRGQLKGAKIAWILGAFAVDASTAYAIWQILFWWYGLAWVVAGAGGIVYSDWLRERPDNNDEQKDIAELGLNVSWVSIVVMAVLAGVALVLGLQKNKYIEGFMILFVVGLFIYHVFQSYRYAVCDDEYVLMQTERKANAEIDARIAEINRAARIVAARKRTNEMLDNYKREHGTAILAQLGELRTFADETEDVGSVQTKNPPKAG